MRSRPWLTGRCARPSAAARSQDVQVPGGILEGEPWPHAVRLQVPDDLGPAPRQRCPRPIKVVDFEQRDDPGAVAPENPEIVVARAEQLDTVVVLSGQLRRVGLVK